jgi:serine phosphatase RsbU (regulator of sigma subunit)
MATLVLLTGAKQGLCLPLQNDRTVLGRDAGCDLVIKENMVRTAQATRRTGSVSRKHAVISRIDGSYYIEDGDGQGTPSRNHTYVNDREVPFPERVQLHNNDHIRICDFGCVFQDGPEGGLSVEAAIDHESSIHSLQAQPAEKLQVILEISNSLSNTLEMDALLPRMIEKLFQIFKQADRGFVIQLDEPSGELMIRAFKSRKSGEGGDGGGGGSGGGGGEEGDSRFSTTIVRKCLEKVQAILGNDLEQQFPESQSVLGLPVRSLMCAPLWSQDGHALGALLLDAEGPKKKFTQEDLNLLLGVASQASIALCNARLYQDSLIHQRQTRDLEIANHVQRALLPQCLPEVPGYELFAHYEPAQEIGGDYYDFIHLPQGRLAILLGDVAGKGVAGALVMVKFSVEVRVCLENEPNLASAMSKLNTIMLQSAVSDRFVTVVAVVLDPTTHTVTLVNAGHPPPFRFCQNTGAVSAAAGSADVAGPPIGVSAHNYGCAQVELQPGDTLVLFSDGVTDALNAQGQAFSQQRAQAVLEAGGALSPRERGERLVQSVKKHASGCPQNDDITLVCFGRAR